MIFRRLYAYGRKILQLKGFYNTWHLLHSILQLILPHQQSKDRKGGKCLLLKIGNLIISANDNYSEYFMTATVKKYMVTITKNSVVIDGLVRIKVEAHWKL